MGDPYNSGGVYAPPSARIAEADASTPAASSAIERLDVSQKWKARFRAIERAGGPKLPQFKQLPVAERRLAQLNWLAFLLGPFYFLAKGLWRQAVVYLGMAVACVLLFEALGWDKVANAVGYGFAAVYMLRANVSYYQRVVLGAPPWL